MPSILEPCTQSYIRSIHSYISQNRIGGVMVSVRFFVGSSTGRVKLITIKLAFRKKSKDWLARNQKNVSEWSDISTRGLLFQWASTIKIQLKSVCLVQSGLHHRHLINLFSSWYSWKIAELALTTITHSLTHSLNLSRYLIFFKYYIFQA